MLQIGFAKRWVDIVMQCARTVRYFIAVNIFFDIGPICHERGLHQGDHLSPYLFILCTKGLSSLLTHA